MTGTLIDLATRRPRPDIDLTTVPDLGLLVGVPLNRCDDPIITGVCAALVTRRDVEQPCGGLLAYQAGGWQHVNACRSCYDTTGRCPNPTGHRSCDDPEPAMCPHGGGVLCEQTVDIDVPCAYGRDGCCGCCWETTDLLEGRRLWPR